MKKLLSSLILAGSTVFALIACEQTDSTDLASGTFETNEVTISSELAGKIIGMYVCEGQRLDSGVVAALIDTVQLDLKRKMLKTQRLGALAKRPDAAAQMAVLEKQIATAMTEKERVTALVAAKASPQKQLDDINGQIELLHKQLVSLKSSLANASSGVNAELMSLDVQIEQVEDMIAKSRMATPISGTVLRTYAEQGEFAVAGKPLFSMANLETLYLRAYITSDQLNSLKIGQSVAVESDGSGESGKRYDGVISWISSKAEFTPKTVLTRNERANLVYAVKVQVKNDGYLRIGMYGAIKAVK